VFRENAPSFRDRVKNGHLKTVGKKSKYSKKHCSKSSAVVLSKSGFQVVFKNCSFQNCSKILFSILVRCRRQPQQIVARDGWRRRG
jgi:hypothetical protein